MRVSMQAYEPNCWDVCDKLSNVASVYPTAYHDSVDNAV